MRAQPPPSPWPPGTPRLRVGDVLVDLRYRQVRHGESVTELPQRMFDLLQVFLAEPHALHTRTDLFERVWGDLVVEDANLSQCVWMLRKALGAERKDWIRTVAKRGYVFAPPAPVEALQDDTAASPALPTGVPMEPALRSTTSAGAPGWSRGPKLAAWSAAALVLVVAAWGAVAWRGREAGTAVPEQQASIALLEVHDRAAPGVNWPADLAHAWLAWKLRSLPEVTLLGESDLAADTGRIATTVVMLSCASGGPGEVVLRARFDDRRQSPIEVRGPVAQAPRLADELSRRALARLVPRRAGEQWPELVLDVASAREYAKAQDALERRDWSGSLPILRKVVRQAPRFGLAQLDLARAESSLGQAGPAVAAMNAARLNLRPLPADAQRLLDARALAVDPQRNNEAAAAYAALAAAWPQRYDILLDHAGYLADAGKPEEARAILQRPEWAQRRTGQRIARLLALAHVDAALGDLQGSKAHASQALALARAAGEGWANERGAALVLLAQLDSALHSNHPDNPLYEQAAREFDASGATADALYARVQRELVRPPGQGNSTRGVDTLLAKAHAEGYRRLEIELLRSVAYQHYQAGQLAAYRELMEQALAAADNAGDVQQQQFFDIDLLGQDYLRGDFASAGRRIARLRKAGLQGSAADAVRDYEAMIAAMRGDYGQALALIDAGLRKSPGAPALAAASSACSRADLLQQQGELTRARTLWLRCAAPDQDALRALARLGRASNDLLAGDRPAALATLRELARQANTTLTGPDRWQSATNIAPLLLRAGEIDDAEALLLPIVADLRNAGYGLLLAQAEATLAEVEAARGHWDASRAHAKAARTAIPADVWVITSRLDNLDIADALARGERNDAETLLARGDANAHRHHDAIAQLELHGLMSPTARLPDGCDATARTALLARTGMRGASLDWLFGPLAARDPLGRMARH